MTVGLWALYTIPPAGTVGLQALYTTMQTDPLLRAVGPLVEATVAHRSTPFLTSWVMGLGLGAGGLGGPLGRNSEEEQE